MLFVLGDSDYTAVNTGVVLSGSRDTEEVTIPTLRDELLESAESFSVELTSNQEENVLLLPSQSTLWIIDQNRTPLCYILLCPLGLFI